MPICLIVAAESGSRQQPPSDEMAAIEGHVRELDRLGEDLVLLDREVAQAVLGNPAVERLITITGVNVTVAAGLVAAIGDIRCDSSNLI
jgi:transposase